ncbi:MAG: proton-conducting transporter membrane subunit, partial [Candidatus Sumerlaeota bacterium]|nr:proton-conducting transporter membrane subunit [Candidatus Sumerlaeota bacterium]
IYAMHHHQEMDKYGGLWRKLPVTFATFLIATLALTGFPWVFSGFHTKDAIIAKATEFGMIMGGFHQILGPLATVAALLTSFYMFRLIFLTFFGKPKDHHLFEHAKESPWTMVTPLVMLAALSFWYVGGPAGLLGGRNVVKDMLAMPEQKERESERYVAQRLETRDQGGESRGQGSGVRGQEEKIENRKPKTENAQETENRKLKTENHLSHIEHTAHVRAVGGSLIVFPLGVLIAMAFYLFGWFNPAVWAAKLRPVYVFLCELWYMDHFYRIVFVLPFILLCKFLGAFDKYVIDGVVYAIQWIVWLKSVIIGVFDNWGIDGMFNGGAWMTRFSGRVLAKAQTGRLRAYLLSIMLGAIMLAVILIFG